MLLLTLALLAGTAAGALSAPGNAARTLVTSQRLAGQRPSMASLSRHRTPRGADQRRPLRPPAQVVAVPPVSRMLGQMIVARFLGSTASPALLGRIRAGQVGGIILFADNLQDGPAAARVLIERLQRAALAGGNPPLLIMTDQEGGEVKRLPGPPTLAPAAMSSPAVAFQQGEETGRLLRSVGVNADLAPVADVERATGSFLGTRSFGSSPATVAADACAFARGLASEHILYTLKHFPGLGRAAQSTDTGPVSIDAPAAALRGDYAAYRTCGRSPLALVMVSSAIYPRLTGPLPAVMSPLTYGRELPLALQGSVPVTISDDLQAPALADQHAPARQAINAGLDLLLYAGSEQASVDAYEILLHDAQLRLLSSARLRAAYRAIIALKRGINFRPSSASPG